MLFTTQTPYEKVRRAIKRSGNINEMQALVESIYDGPNPELFTKSLTYVTRGFIPININQARDCLLDVVDKLEKLPPLSTTKKLKPI